jgi:hypothetical protein
MTLRKAWAMAIIAIAAAWVAGARAQVDERAIGTWKLNLSKSKFTPGPAPQSATVTWVRAGEGVKLTSEGVGADGKPTAFEYDAKYDGKDYPAKGSPIIDAIALQRVDANTTRRTDKKDGRVVQTITRVMSRDGKSFTATTKGKNAKGEDVHNIAVWDKQ